MSKMLPLHRTTLLAIVIHATSLGCSASPDTSSATERADDDGHAIKGGVPATAYPEAVLLDLGGGYCSGSLVAPQLVLTAGHCVAGVASFSVTAPHASGQQANGVKGEVYDYTNTTEYVDPNQHDVGVVFLDAPITLSAYPVLADQPIAGEQVVNVGRIQDGQLSTSSLFVSQPLGVSDGASIGYPLSYVATEVIEPGDSGGPVLVAGDPSHRIVAVNSGGGQGTEILARVDLVHAWLQQMIAESGGAPPQAPPEAPPDPNDPPPDPNAPNAPPDPNDPCQGITYEGICDGDVVVWCEEGELWAIDCAPAACGWNPDASYYDCVY